MIKSAKLNSRRVIKPMPRAFTAVSSRQADKFVVRFPEEMRNRIAQVAHQNHRSMNSEITKRLEESLALEGAPVASRLRLDSTELSAHEQALLKQFRLLTHRQQNALVALIEHGMHAPLAD